MKGRCATIIDEMLLKNPAQVAQFKEGKQQVLGYSGRAGDESERGEGESRQSQ